MDFELNQDQEAVLEAVEALLEQHAGPERAIALQPKGEYDFELEQALRESGFLDVSRDQAMGPLDAALIAEAVARAGGVVSAGASALVAPALTEHDLPGPVSILREGHVGPIRYAAQAQTLLVLAGNVARVVSLAPGDAEPIESNFGYPMGTISDLVAQCGDDLGPGSGEILDRWWRVALAVELSGTMKAALDQTIGYLKERRQFGRAIASFQAVQHRLASCAISVEGSRWLALEAAFAGAPAEMAATAAAYAAASANQVFGETHQLSGAIGYTREHDLHVWSMRLQALRLEMGGVSGHRRAIVEKRWGSK